MEVNRNGPIQRQTQQQQDEARAQLILSVRARTVAAGRELEAYRQAMAERNKQARDNVQIDAARSDAPTAERAQAEQKRSPTDQLELSERARLLARASEQPEDAGRRERLSQLRRLHQADKLNDPERTERAARRMLGEE